MSVSKNQFVSGDSRGRLLRQLRRLVNVGISLREMHPHAASAVSSAETEREGYISSGVAAIDQLLPGGGLCRGTLVEWVGGVNDEARMTNDERRNSCHSSFVIRHSSFSFTLPLLAAREACREGGVLVVIDPARTFYPPAAAAWGIDLQRLIVVHPKSARDALWAGVQSLRSPAVAAVWMDCGWGLPDCSRGLQPRRKGAGLTEAGYSDRAFRRLQLAVQVGRAVGLVLRPASARGQPSWADVRLGVKPRPGDRETGRQGDKLRSAFSPPRRICDLSPGLSATADLRLVSPSSSARLVQIHLLRCRHGRPGGTAVIEIDDAAYTVREARVHHDANPLSVVAELADPATARGAG